MRIGNRWPYRTEYAAVVLRAAPVRYVAWYER